MRCDVQKFVFRSHGNRRGIQMFHASARSGGTLSKMHQKSVTLERRAIHQPQFIRANTPQFLLELFSLPTIALDYGPNRRTPLGDLKFFELTGFNGCVRQRIVARRVKSKIPGTAHLLEPLKRSAGHFPLQGHVRHIEMHALRSALGHVHQYHCRIDEGMFAVQLGREGPSFIPVRGVTNRDGPFPVDAPSLLIHLFERSFIRTNECLDLLHVRAEIAYLVEGVPGGHLHRHFAGDFRNLHGDVKKMALRMRDRYFITNRDSRRTREARHAQRSQNTDGPEKPPPAAMCAHRTVASDGAATSRPSLFNSFSHNPSKLPFDIISKRSPALASAER